MKIIKIAMVTSVAIIAFTNIANAADANTKKLYEGQYASCMKALNNVRELKVIEIDDKTQVAYCKCAANQMVERADIKLISNLVKNDLPNQLNSLIEQYADASMRFCDTKMNLQMNKDSGSATISKTHHSPSNADINSTQETDSLISEENIDLMLEGMKKHFTEDEIKELREEIKANREKSKAERIKRLMTDPEPKDDNAVYMADRLNFRKSLKAPEDAFAPEYFGKIKNPEEFMMGTSRTSTIIKDSIRIFGMNLETMDDRILALLGDAETKRRAREYLKVAERDMYYASTSPADANTWTAKITTGVLWILLFALIGGGVWLIFGRTINR